MDLRLSLLGFLFSLFDTVALEVVVEGYKGGDVLLPCMHSDPNENIKLSDKDMTFFWRYKDSKIVFSFINGKDDLSKQDKQFQNRTSLSPQFHKGNFSLRLVDLKEIDGGQYKCFVPPVETDYHIQDVELHIKEKPQEFLEKDSKSSSIKTMQQEIVVLLMFLLSLVLLSV